MNNSAAIYAGQCLATYLDYVLSFGPENFEEHHRLQEEVVATVMNVCVMHPEMRSPLRHLVTARGELQPPRNYTLYDSTGAPRSIKLATIWLMGGSRNWLGLPKPDPLPESERPKFKGAKKTNN